MTLPHDYVQPDFFRFGEDSLWFTQQVIERTRQRAHPVRLVELGVGSGVITCELSKKLKLGAVDLVEAQQEWKSYLEVNLTHFGVFGQPPLVHWQRVGQFNLTGKVQADLLVTNPPYFDPEQGRPSPNPLRNIAHTFVLEGWEKWRACMERTLAPGGEAWFLQKDLSSPTVESSVAGFTLSLEERSGRLSLFCLRRL